MNIRPDAWRRAFRSPQVAVSVLALLAALVAVFMARPDRIVAEPFELPVVQSLELQEEEFRLISYDRFNLEIPVRETVAVPADAAGRIEAIVSALRARMTGESGSWPAALPLPVVFATELDGKLTAVLDFRIPQDLLLEPDDLERIARSVRETLQEAGLTEVVVLQNGLRYRASVPVPQTAD